jgi:hypothetical protein
MYCFRDGVRVAVDGFETESTETPTDKHLSTCLEGALREPTAYARIAGTTPQQYLAAGGQESVLDGEGHVTREWLEVVRKHYQAAWSSDSNGLLDAWVNHP